MPLSNIKISKIPAPLNPVFGSFNKYANVFGVNVVATSKVSDTTIIHGASIIAQYLDNDEDGVCDDQILCNLLYANHGSLIIFEDYDDRQSFFNLEERSFEDWKNVMNLGMTIGYENIQYLLAEEMIPNSVSLDAFKHDGSGGYFNEQFDDTLRESLHLIFHSGVKNIHKEFGERHGSDLADGIDEINGDCGSGEEGTYKDPSLNQCTGFYAVEDKGCDYDCRINLGIYWSLTSILGAQNYTSNIHNINEQWMLGEPADFKEKAPKLNYLLNNHAYYTWLPSKLPNGRYLGTLPDVKINGVPDYATIVIVAMSITLLWVIAGCVFACWKGESCCFSRCPRSRNSTRGGSHIEGVEMGLVGKKKKKRRSYIEESWEWVKVKTRKEGGGGCWD